MQQCYNFYHGRVPRQRLLDLDIVVQIFTRQQNSIMIKRNAIPTPNARPYIQRRKHVNQLSRFRSTRHARLLGSGSGCAGSSRLLLTSHSRSCSAHGDGFFCLSPKHFQPLHTLLKQQLHESLASAFLHCVHLPLADNAGTSSSRTRKQVNPKPRSLLLFELFLGCLGRNLGCVQPDEQPKPRTWDRPRRPLFE